LKQLDVPKFLYRTYKFYRDELIVLENFVLILENMKDFKSIFDGKEDRHIWMEDYILRKGSYSERRFKLLIANNIIMAIPSLLICLPLFAFSFSHGNKISSRKTQTRLVRDKRSKRQCRQLLPSYRNGNTWKYATKME
jgi:hypothetical protein